MDLYVGIDLHSSNSYVGILNKDSERIMSQRLPNHKEKILMALLPYREKIRGIAIESTYNWYWLVDSLMEENYRVHLGNPSAFQQYKGLKYVNDKHDAFWLAQMLALGLLPEGYIIAAVSLHRIGAMTKRREKEIQRTGTSIYSGRMQRPLVFVFAIARRRGDIINGKRPRQMCRRPIVLFPINWRRLVII